MKEFGLEEALTTGFGSNTLEHVIIGKICVWLPCPENFQNCPESLTNVHLLVRNLFTRKIPNLQMTGRLDHFSQNWEKLTQDQGVLFVVKGYVIPFLNA